MSEKRFNEQCLVARRGRGACTECDLVGTGWFFEGDGECLCGRCVDFEELNPAAEQNARFLKGYPVRANAAFTADFGLLTSAGSESGKFFLKAPGYENKYVNLLPDLWAWGTNNLGAPLDRDHYFFEVVTKPYRGQDFFWLTLREKEGLGVWWLQFMTGQRFHDWVSRL